MEIASTININTIWNQSEINPVNPNNIITDRGQLSYNYTYSSGVPASGINTVFHEVNTLAPSGSITYDLMDLELEVLGSEISKTLTYVKSLSIKNNSVYPDSVLNVYMNQSSGFGAIFGHPTGVVQIYRSGMIHHNVTSTLYPVNSNERVIQLSNNTSYPVIYEIAIMGNE